MTAMELEDWLVEESVAVARRTNEEAARETSRISELEKRIEELSAVKPADCEARTAALTEECARLDASVARLEEAVDQAGSRLVSQIERALDAIGEVEAVAALQDAQELFERYAPDDLPDSVEALPPAMLEAALSRSCLARDLDGEMKAAIAKCHRTLADAAANAPSAAAAGTELERAREEIGRVLARLEEHAVAPEVLRNLDRIEEINWLREEVLEPYTAAAQAEASWRLQRDVFKELGYAV